MSASKLLPAFMAIATVLSVASAAPNCASALGPVQVEGGYCFGVWAPHASSASIVPKSSTAWSQTSLNHNSTSGVFTGFVENAKPGDAYVYMFNGNMQRLDPRAQDIAQGTNNFGYSVIHDPNYSWKNPSFTPPGAQKSVVYEMHIPSFNANGGSGTFASAAQKLGYLSSLGINMIELMPVATFCDAANGWGYNPCAPYAIMNAFGGYNGLKSFVDQANGYGIGVMLDIVWNHMDGGNILEKFDGYGGNAGNGIYFYEDSLNANTFWGPRPNYGSPEVAQYIQDSIRMFLEEYHISGFRWDSTVCIRKPGQSCWTEPGNLDAGWEVMQAGNQLTLQLVPNAVTAAEDSQGWGSLTKPVSDRAAGLPGAPGGAGFVSQWGYKGFFYAFFTQLTEADNGNVDMGQVATLASSSTEGTRVLFTENHDMASNQNHGRIPHVVDPGGSATNPSYWALKKSMMGLSVILTAPGIPMLLQGQEMLSYATFQFPSPPSLDWNLVNSNRGIVDMVTDMIALRTNRNGTSAGLTGTGSSSIQVVDQSNAKVAVIHRYTTGTTMFGSNVLVILNMYNSKCSEFTLQNVPMDGTWQVVFNGDLQKYSSQFGNCGASQTSVSINNGSGQVMLPEYSMVVLAK